MNEILGARLGTIHNLHFYFGLMAEARAAISGGRFGTFAAEFRSSRRLLGEETR